VEKARELIKGVDCKGILQSCELKDLKMLKHLGEINLECGAIQTSELLF